MTSGGLPAGGHQLLFLCGAYLPKVAAFIKSERPARYPGLTIKYVRGADPIIKVRPCAYDDSYFPFFSFLH